MIRAAVLALLLAPAAHAADAGGVAITGRVEHPRTLTLDELRALPKVTVAITHIGHDGAEHTEHFAGALLWPLIEAAHPIDEPGRGARFRHTLLATASDDYAIALAIGEIDPDLEHKQVLVATERDGTPLTAPHLVVPADTHAARSLHDLVRIDVR